MKEQIKDIITQELTHFLVKEDNLPEAIKIELQYENATAQLNISRERLEKLLNKDKIFTPEEVRDMTREQVKDNYTAILRSMKEW